MAEGGTQGLTEHKELQLPGICASAIGGLTAVQPSIRGLDSSKVYRALGSNPSTTEAECAVYACVLELRRWMQKDLKSKV